VLPLSNSLFFTFFKQISVSVCFLKTSTVLKKVSENKIQHWQVFVNTTILIFFLIEVCSHISGTNMAKKLGF